MRATVVAAVLIGVCAAALWLVALVASAPPPAAVVHVLGEARAVVGQPWPVRFGAVREGGLGPARLRGTIALGAEPGVDAAAGFALLPVRAPGRQTGHLEVCLDDGAPCLSARFTVDAEDAGGAAPPQAARFSWLGPPPPVETVGSVARRTSVDVRLPLELDPGALTFTADLARASGPVLLDVLVDGVVRDVVPASGASVALPTPRGLRAGAVVVVHAGGPWPDERGAWAIARVRDPAEPLPAFVARLAREAGAPADLAPPNDDEGTRALLARLRPAALRAPRLPVELGADAPGPPWPELYLAAAAILTALVAAAGRARQVPPLALAAGVGAVLAVCGGLYGVLLLLGR